MNDSKELTYTAPTLGRAIASFGLDIFLFVLIGTLFLFVSQRIMMHGPNYAALREEQSSMQIDSKLYVQEDGILSIEDYLNSKDLTMKEKSTNYENCLNHFYTVYLPSNSSVDGEAIYSKAKITAEVDGNAMFDDLGMRTLTNSDYDSTYLSFYTNLYHSALGELRYIPHYQDLSRSILFLQIAWGVASYGLSFVLFYLAIPLCFSKGKRTLGMLSTQLYAVGNDGMSIPWWKQLLYALFQFVIVIIGSIAALLIPLGVSIGMIILRPSRQSLAQYVCGIYVIDGRNSRIYRNQFEYISSQRTD